MGYRVGVCNLDLIGAFHCMCVGHKDQLEDTSYRQGVLAPSVQELLLCV